MQAKHISYDDMISYLENPMGIGEDEELEYHLITCSRCRNDINNLQGITTGIKISGQIAAGLVEDGKSVCLTNNEISKYVKDSSAFEETKRAVLHIAGCGKCLNDVFDLKRLNNFLEIEHSLTRKGLIISNFVASHPTRITAVDDVARDLVRQAALYGTALFRMRKNFSFAFKGVEPSKDEHYVKIEIEGFFIETLEIFTETPKIIIGITAKGDVKRVKFITYLSNKEIKEELVELKNKRAVVKKNDTILDENSYIKVKEVDVA